MAGILWTRHFPNICLGCILRKLWRRERQKRCLQSSWCTLETQGPARPSQRSKIRKQSPDQYLSLQTLQHTADKETRLRCQWLPSTFLPRKTNKTRN